MRTFFLIVIQAILLAGIFPSSLLHAQNPPADFRFSATTGGLAPWDEKARITIDNTGQARYVRYTTGNPPAVLADTNFTIGAANLQALWKMIQDSSFFSINPAWIDSTAHDGMFARITVSANAATHQVSIKNIAQPAIQGIITILNGAVPAELQLPYSPPQGFDMTPKDPCATQYGALGNLPNLDAKLKSAPDLKTRAFPGPYLSTTSRVPPVDPPHPGTVAACDVTVQDAVANGWASLSSKGNFFGDDVSITVDDQNHPPCNTINLTLYLEFWGPLATEARIDKVCADIAAKWVNATTSSGQKVELGFVTRSNTSATSAPNTPGFHEIELVPKGSVRSYVQGSAGVNSGTDTGQWEVPSPVGTFAHEAGHLMGLPDRYIDFNKQADGSWTNAQTNQSFADDAAFANYLMSRNLGNDLTSLENFLKDADVYSVPKQGSENDLMADVSKPLTQADIDQIAANPGLLVSVPVGTVVVNRDGTEQNIIVTHAEDVFAGPGQTRTLLGIYGACIDHFKDIPTAGGVFDVAPPVGQWTGIQAAGYMAKILRYADSLTLYCDASYTTQEAIWRLSDNSAPFIDLNNALANFLLQAGVSITDQLLDFPRLTGSGLTDSTSHIFIPDELYVADISPSWSNGQVGVPTNVSAHISVPLGAHRPAGFTWIATGPDNAPAAISGSDSTASLTPTRSGVYDIALQISVNDSVQGQKTFTSARKGHVIVPDAYTETFEHPNLTDRYPWKTHGDVPWTITNTYAETGSYSAQPGTVANGQTSTLGIEVSVSSDTDIVFSARTFTATFVDGAIFSIDSLAVDLLNGGSDWTVYKERLTAGNHLLEWKYSNSSATPKNNVWLDNIFFPGNVVVTSVGEAASSVPRVFALDQNYPNPFNPTTVIRSQLPVASNVELTIYDLLGREVVVLVHERRAAGYYQDTFNATGLASGVYFYRIKAGDFVQTRKLTLIR